MKYECLLCDYVYDPARGDATQGVPPDTPFEDLPPDWRCPTCGATQNFFKPVDG
jgi:rubredoxin